MVSPELIYISYAEIVAIFSYHCCCHRSIIKMRKFKVIVGTPGTVIRWLHQLKCFDLKKLSNFILDEADLMLNWGSEIIPIIKTSTLVIGQCVIFCETRSTAYWLVVKIRAKGHRVAVLSGEMIMEQRAEIVKRFRKGVDRILIATSLCSN
ncbi:ATP-dependent RNA helicase DDX19A [Trichinella murrelli]|uniref:RNA helicase n=1 Tax=Trichinella murrelli TaxID=144512 RepID=A0A0V0T2F2_9BILA|nr:ATP-dependent RNA helicase DDX19A [Trichinella murrelli]